MSSSLSAGEIVHALESFKHCAATRREVALNVSRLQDRRHVEEALKHAAVTLVVARHHEEAAIIITRRPRAMREHGGQWALPGGRVDAGETALEAALRELHEEINLEVGEDDVLGVLDDYVTRSGYVITPVVVWADIAWQDLMPNPEEVAVIAPFTFTELSRRDSPHLDTITESDRPVLSMHYEDSVIFAPTGALLYQFREVAILGLETRVAHFEQPVFAWR